jgi:RNase H-like domain found in reverse transcriptase
MKIDHLNFEVEWVPGKKNEEADALSQAPIHQASEEDEIDEIEKNLESVNAINADFEEEFNEFDEEVSDLLIKEVQKEAEKDPDYQLLKNAVLAGDYRVLTVKLDPYQKYLDLLSIDDNGLIIKDGTKLLILEGMRTRLDPALTEALRAFPIPMNQTDVCSFMGLANQMTNFSTEIVEVMLQFKDLLKKETSFIWTDVHQKAFEKAREKLSDSKWLTYFNVKRKTHLQTDASSLRGLGFVLKQEVEPGDWKVVQAGSRFLSKA